MSGTQLYNKQSQKIYPQTEASAVDLDNGETVQEAIDAINQELQKLSGAEGAVISIQFDIKYVRCQYKSVSYVRALDEDAWNENFIIPNSTSPYTWKRTIISYTGQDDTNKKKIYEIVCADVSEISQTLYTSGDGTKQPTIEYPQVQQGSLLVDNTEASLSDIAKASNADGDNWTVKPQDISSANPIGYMAVRNRVDGTWGRFNVAQYSKWSYDSKLDIKYTVTSTSQLPSVSRGSSNPGSTWKSTNQEEFTGYLWIITATIINGAYSADAETGYIWSTPQLISVVK